MKRLFVFFIILFTVGINAQPDQGKPQDYSREPVFYFDIYNFYSGDSANTKVDFFLQLPFEKLSFIKAGEKFRAEYSVSVTVNDENKLKLITEKSWTEKIELLDFNKTNSKSDYNLSARSFKLAPGKYYFTILVEDLDSRKEYRAEAEVPVRTFDQELAISDIMLISSKNHIRNGNS